MTSHVGLFTAHYSGKLVRTSGDIKVIAARQTRTQVPAVFHPPSQARPSARYRVARLARRPSANRLITRQRLPCVKPSPLAAAVDRARLHSTLTPSVADRVYTKDPSLGAVRVDQSYPCHQP
uniref:Uncharacterized protein n=1 Tax=Branchiostoma floridae TaxID=7739 RepID=C3Y2D0_BRAFL|eukprot:XP_002610010.1 hypothetical protein BRAFLDRAFT_105448 [Branchiostoma floridae]